MTDSSEVVLYTRDECSLCAAAAAILADLGPALGFTIDARDVDADPALRERYGERVPVVALAGVELAVGRIDRRSLRDALLRARSSTD